MKNQFHFNSNRIEKLRRKISDLPGKIATCCTDSEEGLVSIIQDNVTGQGHDHGVALVGGDRSENVVGVENSDIDENMAYLAGRIAAVGKKKKRNKRTKNKKMKRTPCNKCKVLGHYGRDCPNRPSVE